MSFVVRPSSQVSIAKSMLESAGPSDMHWKMSAEERGASTIRTRSTMMSSFSRIILEQPPHTAPDRTGAAQAHAYGC